MRFIRFAQVRDALGRDHIARCDQRGGDRASWCIPAALPMSQRELAAVLKNLNIDWFHCT